MNKITENLDLLGLQVTDKVSGYKGVVTSICFDLYGCIQALVHPGVNKDGDLQEQKWFDTNRLSIEKEVSVMEAPYYGQSLVRDDNKGAAEKPGYIKS